MLRIYIQNVTNDPGRPPNVPGKQHTLTFPALPQEFTNIKEFVNWMQQNPDFMHTILTAILEMIPPPDDPRHLH